MSAGETQEGGCHCGQVRFRVRIRERKAYDCNCSICRKKGFLHLIVPEKDFSLLQGGEFLSEYRFNTGIARHLFCRVCGMHPFYRPRSHPGQWDVNVRCLDGDFAETFEILPFDGQSWESSVDKIR
ncbi:MAG TPA: GFA family protein [bacterium]|nr:GFA family protein [bacterium]